MNAHEQETACVLRSEVDRDGGCTLFMEGVLDFDSVPAVHARAARYFIEHRTITADLAGITRCNSAALAMILDWQRFARDGGQGLRLRNLPAALLSIATLCGLEELLPDHFTARTRDRP